MLAALVRSLRLLLFVATVTLQTQPAQCSNSTTNASIVITPEHLSNGSPFLLTVHLQSKAIAVTGKWQNHPIIFFPSPDPETWYSLAGIDVEVTPGTYPLTIEASLQEGTHQTLHREIGVAAAPYTQIHLAVPDKFVQFDAAALKIIAADKILKDKAFAHSTSKPEWSADFRPPLKIAARSDSFGTQRIFNGKLESVHRGLDYHAAPRTPIAAINTGRVVLANPLYFEGGCVVIDHGLGLMSVYMHLSKLNVAVGDKVARGQIIALSGATGRTTGPHLHLGVRWQGSYLDPAKLFTLHLPQPQ
jgi:hypothetical protein